MSGFNNRIVKEGEPVTAREHQVLDLIALGKTNDEIADALDIAHGTVQFYAYRVMAKLGAVNRTHAAALWVERRLRVEFARELTDARVKASGFATNVF